MMSATAAVANARSMVTFILTGWRDVEVSFFRVSKECMEKGDVAMAARRMAVAHVGKHAKQPCGPNKAGWGC